MIVMYVDPPLPAHVISKVLVHKNFAHPSKGFLADPGVENWVLSQKPNVTVVGFGNNNPENVRAYGIMRWIDTKTNQYFAGWKSCSEPMGHETNPMIVLDSNGYEFPSINNDGVSCQSWPLEKEYPEAKGYVANGRGDSGGPAFIGGETLGKENLLPTPPPQPLPPGEPIAVGVTQGGDCAIAYYAPTYTQETSAWLGKMLDDKDGDGVPDPFDVCPEGNDGIDTDEDGFPDDCDPCPWDKGKAGEFGSKSYGDSDGDGVCDGEDNCFKYNPTQANSNEDAERVHKGEALGDGCEPVPVPNFFVQYETTSQCTPTPSGLASCLVRTALKGGDGLLADFQRSASPSNSASTPVPIFNTQVRFCWNKNTAESINCTTDEAINDDFVKISLGEEELVTPFHRITLGTRPREQSFLSLRIYESSSQREPLFWDFDADLIFWKEKGYPHSGVDGVDLRKGRLWMHADTTIGMTAEFNGTGFHRKLDDSPGEQLANHYQIMYPLLKNSQFGAKDAPILKVPACWGSECVAGKQIPPALCPSCDLFDLGDVVSRPAEHRLLASLPGFGLHYLTESGGYASLPETAVSGAARTLIQNSPLWISAAEPVRSHGYGVSVPSLLFLADDGTTVLGGLTVLGGQTFTTQEARQVLLDNRVGIRPTAEAEPEATPAGSTQALSGYRHPNALPVLIMPEPQAPSPPPRPGTSSATVYSTTLGKLFVLRGRDKPGGPSSDLWVRSMRDGNGYKNIPLDQEFGRLVSATFTPVDRKLWVLDEQQGKFGLGKNRILSINPSTGKVDVVATWPRLGVFQQRWLLTDRDGHLLIASSSKALRRHMVARIEVTLPLKVTTLLLREGELGFQPVVESSGYRFLVEGKSKKDPLFHVQRLDSLPVMNKPFDEIGLCL